MFSDKYHYLSEKYVQDYGMILLTISFKKTVRTHISKHLITPGRKTTISDTKIFDVDSFVINDIVFFMI